ncbi:MAG: lipase secretion chaperone [Myxococcota bacterium]
MTYRTIVSVALFAFAFTISACEEAPLTHTPGFVPASLDGTDIDGGFHYDQDGNFIFDQDAQRVFDYVLTAEGEWSTDALNEWVDTMLLPQVPPGQRSAVSASWHAYTRYRAEAAEALVAGEADDLPHQHQQAHQAIAGLVDALSNDAALAGTPFADSERAHLTRAVAVHDVQFAFAQDAIDREARDIELAAFDRDARERFAQTRAGRFLAAREALAAARENGASDASLHDLRVTHYDAISPGAAERLAALDQRRAAWDARVAEYARDCDALRASWTGSEAELRTELDALKARRFNDRERRRLF